MIIKDTITVQKGEEIILQKHISHGVEIHKIVESKAEPDQVHVIISFYDLEAFAKLFYDLGFERGYHG